MPKLTFLVLTSILFFGTFVTSAVFAETVIPYRGTFESVGDSRYFTDIGKYSVFDGLVHGNGVVIWVPDSGDGTGGYEISRYTVSDDIGNSISFEAKEIFFHEYAKHKFGIGQYEWKVLNGTGKFAGATGQGMDRVWFKLSDMSYRGITSGNIILE